MSNTLNFDESFYLSQNPDVAAAISRGIFTSGAQHYQLNGRFEGRNPNAFFNTSFYLGQYPDVAKAGVNPLTHFLTFGVLENRATNAAELTAIDKDGNGILNEFNAAAYLAANSDVAAAVNSGIFKSAYQHFIQFGQFEGRAAPLTNGTSVTGPFGNAGAGGSTFNLTSGVDNLVGTTGNDTFNATNTSASPVLGGLDKIDGGAGIDTLNIADTATAAADPFTLPTGFSISNVEKLAVTTNGAIGSGGTAFDASTITGLTSFTGIAAGTGNSNVKVANTTDASLTVAGTATATVSGGKAVSVAAGTGATTVSGNALTSVTVKGGGVAAIDNLGGANGTTTAVGTTLKAVTLDGVAGATATVKGAAIDTLTLQNQKSALAVTVTNDTSTALNINVSGVGYDATGAAVTDSVAAGSKAETITVNATGAKSNLTVTAAAAKTLVVTGSSDLVLAPIASVTKVDGSAATGGLTLGTLNAATVNVATGSGADVFTVSATAKAVVDAGAGNDIVTLGDVIAAGSTVSLGAGDDILLGSSKVAASTSSATTVIDGGAGIDSVSTGLINAGNAAQFVNFEKLSIASGTSFDASLMTKSTITGVSIDGAASGTVSGLTSSQSLVITADNTADGTTTLQFTNVTGTSDAYDISFNAKTTGTTATPTAITADIVEIQGIENVSIHSNSAAGVASNSIVLKDADARSLVIDGSQALTVSFNTAFGTTGTNTGVTTINGSAATGALNIDITNVKAAAAGLTVIGGSAADTFTTSNFAATLTGGAGTDKFNVAGSMDTSKTVDVVITDLAKGETITFADKGVEVFTSAKVDVSSAQTLDAAVGLAATGDGSTNATVKWFQYGGDTYLVDHQGNAGYSAAADTVVKITGLLDLSTSSFNGATTNAVFTY